MREDLRHRPVSLQDLHTDAEPTVARDGDPAPLPPPPGLSTAMPAADDLSIPPADAAGPSQAELSVSVVDAAFEYARLPDGLDPDNMRVSDLIRALPVSQSADAADGHEATGGGPFAGTRVEVAPHDASVVGQRYKIEEAIGEGGMGRVYRVRHLQLGKSFALKLMRTAFNESSRARELFYREARLASSLSHPNIVSVIDFGEDSRLGAFMTMELLDGEPLSERLRREGRFSLRVACDVLLQIAEALHYIHQRQIVHCDIKPDNILLCRMPALDRRRSVVKLLDFGLARVRSSRPRVSSMVDGTPEYMSPERVMGLSPQPSMDIYGLGVLAYEMLTGKLPFRGSVSQVMEAHVKQPPPSLAESLSEALDERAVALVMRALAKEPKDRQKDMAAFVYELRTLMDMLGFGRRRAGPRSGTLLPVASPRQRHAALAFAATPLPMAGLAPDGTIAVANQAFSQFLTGNPEGVVEGIRIDATRLTAVYPGLASDLVEVQRTQEPLHRLLTLRKLDGTQVRLLVWAVPAGDKDLAVFVTVHTVEA